MTVEQRQVAMLLHEDVLMSFAFADNRPEPDAFERKFVGKLPKCYSLSKANIDQKEVRESRMESVVDPAAGTVTWSSKKDDYGRWLGVINSTRFLRGKYDPKAPLIRKLKVMKLRGVPPLKAKVIMDGTYVLSAPQNLPKPAVPYFRYPKRFEVEPEEIPELSLYKIELAPVTNAAMDKAGHYAYHAMQMRYTQKLLGLQEVQRENPTPTRTDGRKVHRLVEEFERHVASDSDEELSEFGCNPEEDILIVLRKD